MLKQFVGVLLLTIGLVPMAVAQLYEGEFDPRTEGIFIFGVKPAHLMSNFFPIKRTREDVYKETMFKPVRYRGLPIDGYVIGRAKAGEWVALTSVTGERRQVGLTLVEQVYPLCRDVPAIRVEAGQVIYFGDLFFFEKPDLRAIAVGHRQDTASALDFVARKHPVLRERFQVGTPEFLDRKGKCDLVDDHDGKDPSD